MERSGPQVQVAPTRCPYCHEGIPRGEQPAVCPDCHALHHVACLDESGACAACGRKTASPEDSKLTAALRARASARVERAGDGRRDTDPPPQDAVSVGGALIGAVMGGCGSAVLVSLLDPPSQIPVVMAAIGGGLLFSVVGSRIAAGGGAAD